MKILLLNAYCKPETTIAGSHLKESRNEAFARSGFEMLVIAPSSRALTKEMRNKYKRIIPSGKVRGLKKATRSKLTERMFVAERYQSQTIRKGIASTTLSRFSNIASCKALCDGLRR